MILITGATGNNGQEIVSLLSRMGVPCRALVRSNEKASALAGLPGVELAFGDFAYPDSPESRFKCALLAPMPAALAASSMLRWVKNSAAIASRQVL